MREFLRSGGDVDDLQTVRANLCPTCTVLIRILAHCCHACGKARQHCSGGNNLGSLLQSVASYTLFACHAIMRRLEHKAQDSIGWFRVPLVCRVTGYAREGCVEMELSFGASSYRYISDYCPWSNNVA